LGRLLDQVADLVAEVAEIPNGCTAREVHRYIGDVTLSWTGFCPEALHRIRAAPRIDFLVDYYRQGKRSCLLASQCDDDLDREELAVLRWLSNQFEMCAFSLTIVREEWERDSVDATGKIIGMAER
jgi:hypothetical protein